MSRKFFFLFTVCLILIAGMAWGGGSSSSTSKPGGPVEITWVTYQIAPVSDNPSIIEMLNEKFNVKIIPWNTEAADQVTQLNLKIAAGEVPDVFRSSVDQLSTYVEQGVLAEIPEATIKTYAPVLYADWDKNFPAWRDLYKINGKLWAVSEGYSPNGSQRNAIAYRGDWLKNLNRTIPATLADLESLMYAFTNNDPDKNGKKDTYGLSVTGFKMVYGAYGTARGKWLEKNGQLEYSSISSEMKEALTVLARWYRDGVIDPEFVTGENKGGYWAISHAFTEGRIGLSCMGSWYHWKNVFNPNNANYNEMIATGQKDAAELITSGNPVTGPTGKKGLDGGTLVSAYLRCFGKQVEKAPEKMQKWFEIQNWINSAPENYYRVSFGEQGIGWELPYADSVNFPYKIPKRIWDEAKVTTEGGHTVTNMIALTGGKDPTWNAQGLYDDQINSKLVMPQPSASRYQTELNRIEDEAFIDIISGQKPISYFDTFVAQWRAAGGDVLTRETNATYTPSK